MVFSERRALDLPRASASFPFGRGGSPVAGKEMTYGGCILHRSGNRKNCMLNEIYWLSVCVERV